MKTAACLAALVLALPSLALEVDVSITPRPPLRNGREHRVTVVFDVAARPEPGRPEPGRPSPRRLSPGKPQVSGPLRGRFKFRDERGKSKTIEQSFPFQKMGDAFVARVNISWPKNLKPSGKSTLEFKYTQPPFKILRTKIIRVDLAH